MLSIFYHFLPASALNQVFKSVAPLPSPPQAQFKSSFLSAHIASAPLPTLSVPSLAILRMVFGTICSTSPPLTFDFTVLIAATDAKDLPDVAYGATGNVLSFACSSLAY